MRRDVSGGQFCPDEHLVRRAGLRDRAAFEQLYRTHVRRIHNLALRMVSSAQEAEDLTQEIFLQAYRSLPAFRGHSSFYTWIYRIGSNVCLRSRKRQAQLRCEVPLERVRGQGLLVPDPRSDPAGEAEQRLSMANLAESIRALPSNQSIVMVLGPMMGNSYEQMADRLGATIDVVKGRLHRARANLRTRLERGLRQ